MNNFVLIIALILLLVLSFFFSGVENVYVTVNKLRLEKDVRNNKKMASSVLKLSNEFSSTLSTLLLGNALVNPAATSIAAILSLKIASSYNLDPSIAASVGGVIIFLVLLVFCEIIPKTLCLKFNYRLSYLFIYPMLFFKYLFLPINFIMDKFLYLINSAVKKVGAIKAPHEEYYNEEELNQIVDEIEEKGVIDEKTSNIIRSALEFSETEAYEVMTPRVDVFAIDIDDDLSEIVADKDSPIFKYSRVPVYQDTIDNIVGILPTKLLLRLVLSKKYLSIKNLMREPLFVYRSKLISEIMIELRESKQHIVIVKDEYGGTEGIITLEDILEEIIGEIWDESDTVNEPVIILDKGHYLVDGGYNIEDFFELLEVQEDEETDYDTVGGWCVDQLHNFGKVGDVFTYHGFLVKVIAAEEFTVEKIEVIKLEEEED